MHSVVTHQHGFETEFRKTECCVVGGGMAGLCSALASARNGVKTLLIQDRPVLGGNASSEVRMWICGAHGKDAKEGGILEEILLRNLYYNRGMKYTIWDDILYGICREEPLLEVIFSCSVNEVRSEGRKISGVTAWHLTRQCYIEVEAKAFVDASGDSVLSTCGAEMRWGRESRHEYDESHAPEEADDKTMGNSVLIQLREVDEHVPFTAPPWAKTFEEEALANRGLRPQGNFWWLEFGGIMDTIADSDKIRDENLAIAYGAWDLIKNHPDGRGQGWELEWIGSLPGKRENKRYVGDVLLNQRDVEAGGDFEDVVAHGGWSMDDHHPDAINHRGPPTIFHPAPSPYGIPYRSLYSKDFDNLWCAGRNISATHMAMSSTRVMGTTSVMGQAVGTAVSIAIKKGISNRGVYGEATSDLQAMLLEQDQYLPGYTRSVNASDRGGSLEWEGGDASALLDGHERQLGEEDHGVWMAAGEKVTWNFSEPKNFDSVRLILDSDFSRTKRMPCSFPKKGNEAEMPAHLLKNGKIEVKRKGKWEPLHEIENNFLRRVQLPLEDNLEGVRFTPTSTWGGEKLLVYSFDLLGSD
jgi:ribulose 1,5-bisphosphate synthetase/thiazole synthase